MREIFLYFFFFSLQTLLSCNDILDEISLNVIFFFTFYFKIPGIFIPADDDKISSLEFSSLLGSINNLEKLAKKQLCSKSLVISIQNSLAPISYAM